MNDSTTQLLLVGALVYVALQAQKRAKERDQEPRPEAPAPSGARTRVGRIADDAQRLRRDSQGFLCDNFGLFCG
jgi:hypothetical protein